MADNHKRPYHSTSGKFHWFNAEQAITLGDPDSDIPEPVYAILTGREGLKMVFRDYDTLRAADEDFYAAWAEARRRGWGNA